LLTFKEVKGETWTNSSVKRHVGRAARRTKRAAFPRHPAGPISSHPLPQKVWVGTCSVILIAPLILGCFALPRSPEGRGNHQVEEKSEKPD